MLSPLTKTFTKVRPLGLSLELQLLTLKPGRRRRVEKRIKFTLILLVRGRSPRLLIKENVSITMEMGTRRGIAQNTWLRRRKPKNVNMIYLFCKLV